MIMVGTLSAWRYTWGLPRPELPGREPQVVVIVAVKGLSDLTREFFRRLLAQAYSRFRIIVAVESEDDPVVALIDELRRAAAPIELAVSTRVTHGGQKVANLLVALDKIRHDDEIVVFTDADTLPEPLWLGRLVSAIVDAGQEAVTGYRFMIPVDGRLSSAVVAVANASIVTLPRVPAIYNLCWGGAMALSRSTLERINIRDYWRGAVSDDLQMTRALDDHGIKIFAPRQSLLLSPVAMDWKAAFYFGQRQYRMIWTHVPVLWVFAVLCMMIPVISLPIACIQMAGGSAAAASVLVIAIASGEMRLRSRRRIANALWGDFERGNRRAAESVERWLRPLVWLFHAACVLTAAMSRRFRWAGVDYHVVAARDVRASHADVRSP
jgi:cellulose synthase/poly-beta-1,6-N-acetylglucosamine synthase-like glycosyltransferase